MILPSFDLPLCFGSRYEVYFDIVDLVDAYKSKWYFDSHVNCLNVKFMSCLLYYFGEHETLTTCSQLLWYFLKIFVHYLLHCILVC